MISGNKGEKCHFPTSNENEGHFSILTVSGHFFSLSIILFLIFTIYTHQSFLIQLFALSTIRYFLNRSAMALCKTFFLNKKDSLEINVSKEDVCLHGLGCGFFA